jgi:iron complex transport system permease protein
MKIKKKLSPAGRLWLLAALLVITAVVSLFLGRYEIRSSELLSALFGKLFSGEKSWTDMAERVIFNIRLPRILLACLVGCALSAAGCAYQGVFQNPMAAPDILGATSGAAFGAALGILLGGSGAVVTLLAFVFGLSTVGGVYAISLRARGKKVLTLVLSGIVISSLFSAGTSFIKLVADPSDQLPAITYWLMGSLSGVKLSQVAFAAIPIAIGLVPLILLRWRMNVLSLGDDEAKSLGVNAERVRLIIVLSATLITAASVSVSGMIGWVGLVIPHLCRRLFGNSFKYLIPASMLFGALFLLLVDDVSRNLLTAEIPIGILTAFIGAPFFIWLITRGGERA